MLHTSLNLHCHRPTHTHPHILCRVEVQVFGEVEGETIVGCCGVQRCIEESHLRMPWGVTKCIFIADTGALRLGTWVIVKIMVPFLGPLNTRVPYYIKDPKTDNNLTTIHVTSRFQPELGDMKGVISLGPEHSEEGAVAKPGRKNRQHGTPRTILYSTLLYYTVLCYTLLSTLPCSSLLCYTI